MAALRATEVHLNDFANFESPQPWRSPLPAHKGRHSAALQTFYLDIGNAVTKGGNLFLDEEPILVCPSRTFRTRRQSVEQSVSGNNVFMESSKTTAKSVLESFRAGDQKPLEDFMDYALTELEITQKDRLIFSEPLGIFPKFRDTMFEMAFECYNLAEVMPVVEPVSAGYQLWKEHGNANSLLVAIGAQSTHLLPFVGCNLDIQGVRRLSLGAETAKNHFCKLFSLKYTAFNESLSSRQVGSLFERNAFTAFDYKTQLRYYQDLTFGNGRYLDGLDDWSRMHLRPQISLMNIPGEVERKRQAAERQAQQAKRQEALKKMGDKLRENLEAKRRALEAEYEKLADAADTGKNGSKQAYKSAYTALGYEKEDEFVSRLQILRKKLGKETPVENPDRFKLLEVPDQELSPQRLKQKRILAMQKAGQEKRLAKRIEKDARTRDIDRMKTEAPGEYLRELKTKRKTLKDKIKRLRYFKEDPNFKKQKNNHLIERLDNWLAGEDDNPDEDPLLRVLVDVSSDCERCETEVQLLNGQIKELEPEFDEDRDNEDVILANMFASTEQVDVGADIVRSAEALFRPQLVGSSQRGLLESVTGVLKTYDAATRDSLLSNVWVVGGGALISGTAERIQNDLWVHFSGLGAPQVVVNVPSQPTLCGYQGVRTFMKDFGSKMDQWTVSKREYEEFGPRLFKGCPIGNI